MHARLVTITGTDVDAALKFVDEKVGPAAAQQRGFRQLAASGDRSRGVLSVVSVWETKQDLDASDSAIAKLRQEALSSFGGQADVAVFEEVVMEVGATPPAPGCVLQVARFHMDPGKIDANVEVFKNEVVPRMKSLRGFRAVRQMIDRTTGEGRTGIVFSDRAAMEAGQETRSQLMKAARERGIEFGADDVLEVLYGRMAAS
jgi:heme-degrading monooxygenase HmoA